MASNAWNDTIADVNKTLASMNTAISSANGAAESARDAAEAAEEQGGAAEAAAHTANENAEAANTEANKWAGATVSATTLEPGEDATVSITEKDGVKHLEFGIPRGADGEVGPKGNTGKSGVTFTRSGTVLYITTEK